MACLPPVPQRPTDRPETWDEYRVRRAAVVMHRRFNDLAAASLRDGAPFFNPCTYSKLVIPNQVGQFGLVQDVPITFEFTFEASGPRWQRLARPVAIPARWDSLAGGNCAPVAAAGDGGMPRPARGRP